MPSFSEGKNPDGAGSIDGNDAAADPAADLDRHFRRIFPEGDTPAPVLGVLRSEAEAVVKAHTAGDGLGVMQIRDWVEPLFGKSAEEICGVPLTTEQIFDGVAREHGYPGWRSVEDAAPDALLDPVFERAVDAVVAGRLALLRTMVDDRPSLVTERSAFGHRATLLHYVAANGVETRRQTTARNAPEIVGFLTAAGAEVDALCETYGGGPGQTTLCLAVSSGHPVAAGVQSTIAEALLDAGAAVDGLAPDAAPLSMALAFGHLAAAEFLISRGATVDDVSAERLLGLQGSDGVDAGGASGR